MKTTDKYCDFAKSEIQTATVDFSNKSMQNSACCLCMSMIYQAFCPYLDFSRATRILRVLVGLPVFAAIDGLPHAHRDETEVLCVLGSEHQLKALIRLYLFFAYDINRFSHDQVH